MSQPFTTGRVTRFLVLWILAMAAFYGLFLLLTHVSARESISPGKVSSHLNDAPASPERKVQSASSSV